MITINFQNERLNIVDRIDAKVGNIIKRDNGNYFYVSNVPDIEDDSERRVMVEGVFLSKEEYREIIIDGILN